MTGPVLTTDGAAAYCGLAVGTFRNLLSQGVGPKRYKQGRKNAFYSEDLDRWLASRLTSAEPSAA